MSSQPLSAARFLGPLLARGLSLAAAFGLHLFLARWLGVEAYGAWALVCSWALLIGPLCALGMDQAGPRFVAVHAAQGEWSLLRGFLRRSRQVAAGAGGVAALLGAGLLAAFGARLDPELLAAAWLGLPLLVLLPLLYAGMSALRGARRAAQADLIGVVLPAALTCAGVPLLAPPLASQARGALLVYGGALLIAVLLCRALLRRALPAPTWSAAPVMADRAWFAVALPGLGGLIAGYALTQTDLLVVGALRGVEEAGLYAAAARLGRVLALSMVAIEAAAAPVFAELHARGDRDGLAREVRAVRRAFLALGLGGGAGLCLAGPALLGAFGPEFRASWPALGMLTLGQVVVALCGPLRAQLLMTGHERALAGLTGLAALLNLSLALALVPRWGMSGAAAATGAATAFGQLLLLGYSLRAAP